MTVLSCFKSAFVVSTHNNPNFRFCDLTKVKSTFRIFSMLKWVLYGSRNIYGSQLLFGQNKLQVMMRDLLEVEECNYFMVSLICSHFERDL